MSPIVVITNKIDVHVPYVSRHLDEPPLIIDPMEVIQGKGFGFGVGATSTFRYCGKVLDDVQAVWLRKPSFYEPKHLLHLMEDDPVQLKYSVSGLNQLANGLLNAFDDAYWLSARHRDLMEAENKPRQLRVAKKLGFAVPETLITADPKEAQEFVESRARCIAKPLGLWSPPGRKQYTSLVPKGLPLSFYRNVLVDPTIFQDAITPVRVLRVNGVEDEIFAAEVISRAASSKMILDWRQSLMDETFSARAFEMDAAIVDLCVEYMRVQRLRFGAFDLLIDADGVYWFIECNANGQWAFIEEETRQPIGRSIARRLQAACV
jgi:hypothetical protein